MNKQTKYFCIGRNKTGTTSLKEAFISLGFIVGDQREAELLFDKYYFQDNYSPIIEYSKTAEVFQDVPFSYPETYKYIDAAFPNSKFILTIRDDPEQWYNSITKFHAKKFGKNGRIPTVEDLKNAEYVFKGFMYNTIRGHKTSDNDPYNKKIMINHYKRHNEDIIEYFKNRPEDLLVLNLSKKGSYTKFIDFLNIDSPFNSFPWRNKTSKI